MREVGEVDGDAEQRETCNQHAGDGAGLEGEFKPAGQRRRRGLRGAHVGANRDVHADEAGSARQHRADQEARRDQHAEEVGQQRKDHDADHADGHVLALEIGLRAFAHRGRDFLHTRIAGVRLSKPMPSPRWRKRWKALRRAQSPIMLSLNLPQILM